MNTSGGVRQVEGIGPDVDDMIRTIMLLKPIMTNVEEHNFNEAPTILSMPTSSRIIAAETAVKRLSDQHGALT